MTLRTYRGSSMADALAQVKQDLGRDAVILHTRQIKSGGLMGLGGSTLIEITASPPDPAAAPRPRRSRTPAGFSPTTFPDLADQPAVATAVAADTPATRAIPDEDAPAVVTRAVDPSSLRQPADAPPSSPTPKVRLATPSITTPLASRVPINPTSAAAGESLHEELAAIKRLVGQVLQCSRQSALTSTLNTVGAAGAGAAVLALGGMPPGLFDQYTRALEQGIAPEICDLLVGQVRDEIGSADDPDRARAAMIRAAARLLPRAEDVPAGTRRVIAMIGPTGVGKTTTIAKLAALFKLRDGLRVGLVTSDTYRIAAVEQLRTYATIIGLPMRVAVTPQDMRSEIAALAACDVVLADTAGRSHHDAARLGDLASMIHAAEPTETHLVLSAAAGEPVMRRVLDAFSPLRPDRLVFTKLDECDQPGPLLNVAVRAGLPLSYITLGQEVPDDIAPADPQGVASIVLGHALIGRAT